MEPGTWNMLRQYLSGIGAGLNPDPWVQNINKMTQKSVAAQSQAGLIDLYKQILAGKMPGAKANLSEKGMNLTMPSGALGMGGGGAEGGIGADSNLDNIMKMLSGGGGEKPPGIISGSGMSIPTQQTPNVLTQTEQAGKGGFLDKLLNPSDSQPGITPSDLAGLTPQDVSAALSGAMGMEQLRQKQIMSTFQMIQPSKVDPLEGEFPIQHPEAGPMTLRQWNALPSSEKEFSAYVNAAKELGAPSNELTRKFFSSLEPTEREQFIRSALDKPEIMKGAKELARSGATRISIGEKLAEKKAFADIQGQLYFKDPDWVGDLSKHMSSKAVRSATVLSDDPGTTKAKEQVKFIESKISAGGGAIQDVKFAEDGKTMIWTIKWPSGDIEEVKHAIRD